MELTLTKRIESNSSESLIKKARNNLNLEYDQASKLIIDLGKEFDELSKESVVYDQQGYWLRGKEDYAHAILKDGGVVRIYNKNALMNLGRHDSHARENAFQLSEESISAAYLEYL